MPTRISTHLGIAKAQFDTTGAFDRLVEQDSRLHVDPHLLATSDVPEMVAAAATLDQHWSNTVAVVRNIYEYGDRLWREAVKMLMFPENTNTGLGYSETGTSGSAVGEKTARALVETSRQIIRAGIEDPKIFELVGLLEKNVGPDLISDTTVHIVEQHILAYTQRICLALKAPTQAFTIKKGSYQLPADSDGNHLVILPRDVLRDLPVAFCWEDVDAVCQYNSEVRSRMNTLIGENWREATEDHTKNELKKALIDNPEALRDLVQQYRDKPGKPYDFAKDVLGETIWLEAANDATAASPLDLSEFESVTPDNIVDLVERICDQFRKLVEYNGLAELLWTDDGKVRRERFVQKLFFGVADSYCKANNVDLSPECDSGRGPIDFKLSSGYDSRVLVELKWSKNTKLVHGYETQLKEYEKAESTFHSLFLVIQVSPTDASVNRLLSVQAEAIRAGKRAPNIRVVDGRIKKSASKFEPDH